MFVLCAQRVVGFTRTCRAVAEKIWVNKMLPMACNNVQIMVLGGRKGQKTLEVGLCGFYANFDKQLHAQ